MGMRGLYLSPHIVSKDGISLYVEINLFQAVSFFCGIIHSLSQISHLIIFFLFLSLNINSSSRFNIKISAKDSTIAYG